MNNEGMVAVVRGTTNSGLCVTLLDGNRQYTLQPKTAPIISSTETRPYQTTNQASQSHGPNPYVVENSAQAVDGRYASVYQTVHCNLLPTSPTVDVSEFPPQRPAITKGHGNFEVGGLGSGETSFYPMRVKDSYRGGLSWPERGSVFSPRPSVEPDRFASSLRKYPNLSPERSTEIVERLINYAQCKNSKLPRLHTRLSEYSPRSRKIIEAEIRTDESPTRERSRRYDHSPDSYELSRRDNDRSRKYDEGDRKFDRSYEIRNFRDMSRRGREAVRNLSPYSHPACPTIKERYDHLQTEEKREPLNVQISIDTQVELPVTSTKEVATVTRMTPSVRNVAIPISPLPSILALSNDIKSSKSVQTLKKQDHNYTLLPRKSVQTCFSSIDITNNKIKNGRKSKSQEEIRETELDDEVLQLVQDLTGPEEKGLLRDDLVKKLKKFYKADKNDRLKYKTVRSVKDQLFSGMDLKDFTRELSNQLLYKMKKNSILHCNLSNLYRADMQSHDHEDNCVDDVIKEWLRNIPIKNKDYAGKNFKKEHLLTIANKIKSIVVSKLKLDNDKSLMTEIIQLIEDIPIAVCGFNKRLYLNRLVTDLIRRIKETITMCSYKAGKTYFKNNINDAVVSNNNTTKEEEIRYNVRELLADFVRQFHLKICTESMLELELELSDIVLDAMVNIQTGNEDTVKEDILFTLLQLLDITEYQANYFANNMILNMKKILNDKPKIKTQTFFVLNTKTKYNDAEGLMDEYDIKANLVWYTNQIIKQINKWVSNINGIDPNNNLTKKAIHDLAVDIVDRHKYLELNPTTKVTKTDEIEHLKYQIFKGINKLVGEDILETVEMAPELMKMIKNIPIPMLIKPRNTTQGFGEMGCDFYNRPRNNNRRANKTVDYGKPIGRSNITVAMGSVLRNKTPLSDSEDSQGYNEGRACCASLPEQGHKLNTAKRMSDPTESRQRGRSVHPPCKKKQNNNGNMPAEQKTQEQIIEEFDQFLKDWVERIPICEKPELIEKCRLGIYNGVWKAITKIKMNPEAVDNTLLYKDVFDDEIEELLDCLTQTPELKKQRNGLKAEILEKAADISMRVVSDAHNTSYKQQLVENLSNSLPKNANRVDHTGQDLNQVYEDVMKLHLADYFILYTKYREEDAVKANVYKRKLLQEVHELVDGVKQSHGKELREIEAKQYVEGVIHALQKVPVPNDETVNLETDEIILALEVEQWFSDLPLIPNDEHMDMLSRRKYRDILAKKLFDLENSSGDDNTEQMKEEITKFLQRMPFIPGAAENMPLMVEELVNRIKNRPKSDADDDSKNGVAFMEPHGYEAFTRDMPLCSSYTEDQNGSSYMIVGGERAANRSMAYGGQYVQSRNDRNSQQKSRLSLGQSSTSAVMNGSSQGTGPCWGQSNCSQSTSSQLQHELSQQKRLSLETTTMNGPQQGGDPCCGRPNCSQSTSPPLQRDADFEQKWLTLETTTVPGAMNGLPQSGSPCCGRPACSRSNSHPLQRDSESHQKGLSLGTTTAPGAMNGPPQGGDPCCGRPNCSQSTSPPLQRDADSHQNWLTLETTTAPGAMNGFPQGRSPCCGRPSYSQSTSHPQQRDLESQQKWLTLETTTVPEAMNGPPQSGSPCCGRQNCSQNTSTPLQRDSESQPKRLSLGTTTAPGAMNVPQEDGCPSCGRQSCSQNTSPPLQRNLESQQKWLTLETTTIPEAMNGPPQGGSPCCERPACSRSNSPPLQRDSASQQKRLSLGTTTAPGAMTGLLQSGSPCCSRPACSRSTSPPLQRDLESQQKWLTLETTTAPGVMNAPPEDGSPCCGRLGCSQGTSPPIQRDADSQQKWLTLETTTAPAAMNASLEDGSPCCGRPDFSQNTSPQLPRDSESQQKRLSLGTTTAPRAMNGHPKSGSPCCERPACSRSTSPPLQRDSESQKKRLSLGTTTAPGAMNGHPKSGSPCCERPACSRSTSPPLQRDPEYQQKRLSLGTTTAPGAMNGPPQGGSPCCGRPNCSSPAAQSKLPSIEEQSSFVPTKTLSTTKGLTPLDNSCCKRATCPSQNSTQNKRQSFAPMLDTAEKASFRRENSHSGTISKGHSSAKSSSDEDIEHMTSKAKPKKSKKQQKNDCKCFDSRNKGKVSRNQLPIRGNVSRGQSLTNSKVSRDHSPSSSKVCESQSSDEYSRPRTSKTKLQRNKNTLNTTQTHSELPESTRLARPINNSPEEFSGRPVGYSTPHGTLSGPPNTCKPKRENKNIEQDRKEGARRRLNMSDTDESDGDDVKCKCMERIWKWRRRQQCRPCEDNLDFMYPFPFMYPPPPYCYFG